MNVPAEKMATGAVGVTLLLKPGEQARARAESAHSRMLEHFPWLKRGAVKQGDAELVLCSHAETAESVFVSPAQDLFVLVGSPMNRVAWDTALRLLKHQGDASFVLPWEGRCVLVRVSADGRNWTVWNDWCGSIPMYHAVSGQAAVLSSAEPVAVAAAGYGPGDFSERGIVESLLHGHFMGQSTLHDGMTVLPPDSVSHMSDGRACRSSRLWTVRPTDDRWGMGREEILSGLREHLEQAVVSGLSGADQWELPLSGGMDSRLIACIGARHGVGFRCYTYGPRRWTEVVYARRLARALRLPWQRIDPGARFLVGFTRMWLEWFGAALHAHGMYQMPLLTSLGHVCPITTGFIGDPLGGLQIASMADVHEQAGRLVPVFLSKMVRCSEERLSDYLAFSCREHLAAQEGDLQAQYDELPGVAWHKRWFLFQWNHVCRFSYYQNVVGNVLGNSEWPRTTTGRYEMTGHPEYTEQSVIYRLGYPNMGNNAYSLTNPPGDPGKGGLTLGSKPKERTSETGHPQSDVRIPADCRRLHGIDDADDVRGRRGETTGPRRDRHRRRRGRSGVVCTISAVLQRVGRGRDYRRPRCEDLQ